MNNRFLPALITLALMLALYPRFNARAQEGSPTPEAVVETAGPTGIPDFPRITSPQGGQALQGSLPIEGYIPPESFARAELDFAYQTDATRTWFLIAELDQIPDSPVLAQWDTTTITDGVYSMQLVVIHLDGSRSSMIITGLRVRNYSPVETITPTPVTPTGTPEPGEHPVPTATPSPSITPVPPTPTPLPPNPAQIDQMDMLVNAGKGALAALGFLSMVGIYQAIKALTRNRKDHPS